MWTYLLCSGEGHFRHHPLRLKRVESSDEDENPGRDADRPLRLQRENRNHNHPGQDEGNGRISPLRQTLQRCFHVATLPGEAHAVKGNTLQFSTSF